MAARALNPATKFVVLFRRLGTKPWSCAFRRPDFSFAHICRGSRDSASSQRLGNKAMHYQLTASAGADLGKQIRSERVAEDNKRPRLESLASCTIVY